jgi:DNA-binding LacI/PurR family transcriptional regulator
MLHPFHSRILVSAEALCAARDYSLLFLSLRYATDVPWRELHLPQVLQRHDLISGFILTGANSQNLFDLLDHRGIPFTVLGNNVLGEWRHQDRDAVWFDDALGAYELTRYVQSLGHRDIWYVGNAQLPWFARRGEGYRRAMEETGLAPRFSEVNAVDDQDIGYISTKLVLARKERVSAVLTGGDRAAEGVYRPLRDFGLRIPQDVSVAGFNDIEGALLHPPLTTVRVFTDQVGQQLVELLLNRIEHPHLPPQHITLPTQLVRRESCQPISAAPEPEAVLSLEAAEETRARNA